MTEERVEVTSLGRVKQQEKRLEELHQKAQALAERDEQLSAEIAQVLAEGGDPSALGKQRTEVVDLLRDLERALPIAEAKTAEMREAACWADAENRMIAISRAHGSVRASLEQDGNRIVKCAESLIAAIEREHERRRQLATLAIEADLLCARWPDLERPDLPRPPGDAGAAEALSEVRAAMDREPPTPKRFRPPALPASATDEERRLATLEALSKFIKRHGLEGDGLRIIEAAGIPQAAETERSEESGQDAHDRFGTLADAVRQLPSDIPLGGTI